MYTLPGSDEMAKTYVVLWCILCKPAHVQSNSDTGILCDYQDSMDSPREGHNRVLQGLSVLQGMFHAKEAKN